MTFIAILMMFLPLAADQLELVHTHGVLQKIKLCLYTLGATLFAAGELSISSCGQGVSDIGQNMMIVGTLLHFIDTIFNHYLFKNADDN